MYSIKSSAVNLVYAETVVLNPSKDCIVSMEVKNKNDFTAYVSFRTVKNLYKNVPIAPMQKISIPEFAVKKNVPLYGNADYFSSGNVDCTLNISELN